MVRVGYAEIRDPEPAQLELLPEAERDREFAAALRRREFHCGRLLLRLMLQQWTGRPPAAHTIAVSDKGKPLCPDGPAISIAHSGSIVAAGVADRGELGIDLEVPAVHRTGLQIARRYFSQEEADWLETQPEDRFVMLWVLKEAFAKAMGESIFGQLDSFACRISPPHIHVSGDHPSLQALALYRSETALIGIAATGARLSQVEFQRWDLQQAVARTDDTVKRVGRYER